MELSKDDLLGDWYRRIRYAQFAHYESAKLFDRVNYWLGIPVVVLSTFVGTSVFANIGRLADPRLQIAIGLISVVAATLASLQTFFRFAEKAEKHRTAAAKYGALRRQVEETLALQTHTDPENIVALRQSIDRLAEEAPQIPHRIWSNRRKVAKDDKDSLVGLLSR